MPRVSAVRTSIEIAAAPERVWSVVMDPHRLGEWVTIHRRLGAVSDDPLEQDSTLEQTVCLRGATFKVRWRVVELEAPHRAVWEGRGPARSRATITDELRATSGGTRFDYVNEFRAPGGPLGAAAGRVLVGGLSQREAERSLRRLKEVVEDRA